jgi:hypothetical protein
LRCPKSRPGFLPRASDRPSPATVWRTASAETQNWPSVSRCTHEDVGGLSSTLALIAIALPMGSRAPAAAVNSAAHPPGRSRSRCTSSVPERQHRGRRPYNPQPSLIPHTPHPIPSSTDAPLPAEPGPAVAQQPRTPASIQSSRHKKMQSDVHDALRCPPRCTPALHPFHTHGKVV